MMKNLNPDEFDTKYRDRKFNKHQNQHGNHLQSLNIRIKSKAKYFPFT